MLRLAVLLLIAPAAAWLSARAPRATVSMRATASRRQALVFPAALLIASSVSAEDVAIDAASGVCLRCTNCWCFRRYR